MPGFVKIGLTQQDDVASRIRQLDNTSIPMPFELFFAAKVPDCRNRKVTFEGEDMSPSAAALTVILRMGYDWTAVSGMDYWTYNGKRLSSLDDDTDEEAEEYTSASPTAGEQPCS